MLRLRQWQGVCGKHQNEVGIEITIPSYPLWLCNNIVR